MNGGLAHAEMARGVGLAMPRVEEGAQIGVGDFTRRHEDGLSLKETSLQDENLSNESLPVDGSRSGMAIREKGAMGRRSPLRVPR